MIVTIITLDTAFKVAISTPKPEILSVGNLMPINVSVSVIRDGEKGADAINNTLELVRAERNVIEGNIDGNGNTIENIRNAVDNQEPATLAQLIAATQEAKDYADTVSVDSVRWGGYWDASTGIFPSNSLTRRGDEFEVSVAGTFSNIELEVGDIIRARINVPGQNIANWSISQGNIQQATTSRQGTSKVALISNVNNENTTDNSNFVTPNSLWGGFVQRFLQLSWVWSLRQTFSTAPRLSSLLAGQFLKLDSNKDVIGFDKIQHLDINEVDKFQTNIVIDYSPRQVSTTGEKAFAYYKIDAGTLKVGSVIQIDTEIVKTIVGNNSNLSYLLHNTSQKITSSNLIFGSSVAANIADWRMKAEIIILPNGIAKLLLQPTSAIGLGTSPTTAVSFPFNVAIDNYFFATVNPGNNNDIFKQLFFLIKKIN